MRKEESKAAHEFFYELSGIADVRDCAIGSVAGCIWAAIGVVPVVGKAAAAHLLQAVDRCATVSRPKALVWTR